MESTQALPANEPRSKVASSSRTYDRFFYSGSSALLFMLMFWGFHLFYLHGQAYPGRPLNPPIRPLLIAHGIAMSVWMVLAIIQPLLIAMNNRRTHMKLGLFGAGLAVVATVLGVNLAVASARVAPPEWRLWGLDSKQFMMVSLSAIALFAVFVSIGILNRRKPEAHRPMMLLATLAPVTAALDRIAVTHHIFEGSFLGTLFGPYASSLSIGLVLLCLNCALSRKLNRPFAIGYAGIVAVAFATMHLAPTPLWASFANLLAS